MKQGLLAAIVAPVLFTFIDSSDFSTKISFLQ